MILSVKGKSTRMLLEFMFVCSKNTGFSLGFSAATTGLRPSSYLHIAEFQETSCQTRLPKQTMRWTIIKEVSEEAVGSTNMR